MCLRKYACASACLSPGIVNNRNHSCLPKGFGQVQRSAAEGTACHVSALTTSSTSNSPRCPGPCCLITQSPWRPPHSSGPGSTTFLLSSRLCAVFLCSCVCVRVRACVCVCVGVCCLSLSVSLSHTHTLTLSHSHSFVLADWMNAEFNQTRRREQSSWMHGKHSCSHTHNITK